MSDSELIENCLNNLGEAFRKSGKSEAAIALFVEAEALARKRSDREAEVSIAHNRALAFEDLGRQAQAFLVLIHCRDEAFENELWEQYVRALHGLANHAWQTSKVDDTVLSYREAFAEARRHKLDDQAASIAVNYTNALRYKSQIKTAFQVLESVDGRLVQMPDNHEYYSALAASAVEIGDKARAKGAFFAALRAAEVVSDIESAASASGGLAELLEEEADWDGADYLLKKALATDVSNEHKAALLTQRFGLLLKARRNRQAGLVFRQIQELTSAAGLNEESVNAYMMLGDHEWEYGESKTKAK